MATIGELFVNINARTDDFERGVNRTKNSANGLNGVFGNIKKTIAGFLVYDLGKTLVGGLVSATKAGINYNATLETSQIAWTTLLGTQGKANKMLKDIENYAKNTPFEKMGVDNMAKQLNNAGFEGKGLFDQLTKFGDIGGAFGIQQASLEEMVRQYSQVKQAGVAYTEDLNILQDRGIPIYKAIAKECGISTAEVKEWASDGKISADIYQKALDGVAKGVEGGMAKQSKSFTGMVSTLKDGFGQAIGILSKPMFDKLTKGLEKVLPFIDKVIDSLGKKGLMKTVKEFAPSIMPFVQLAISIFKSMGDTVGVIIKSMTDFWNEHKGWLMPVITFLFTFIAAIVTNTITAIGNIVQSGLAVVDGIINFFQNLFKGNFKGCWDSIKQIFFNALIFVWNWMQVQFAVNLPNMIKNFGRNFKVWIDDAWVAVKKFFKKGADDVWKFAKQGFKNAYNSVKEWISKVPTEVKKFMGKAVDHIKGIDLFQIGKDMINGLINGIKDSAGGVLKAVGGVVGGAIEAGKKKLGIQSPSKVFKEFGKFTGEGLAIGIENEKDRVSKASIGLSKSVIGGYNAKLKGLSGSFKSDTANNNKNVNINVQNMNVVDKGDKNRTLSQISFLATV